MLQEQAQQRRLATIVAVDVAGYSARAEADQDAAADEIAGLARLVDQTCARFGGRLFNSAGDGFMLEFSTVTGALEAAEHLASTAVPPVRIGVHLGEVRVAEDGDLLGHGVNVAARIQALAFARTVLVSADVRRAIRGPLADRLKPKGSAKLDKMDETVELFALAPAAAPAVSASPAPRLLLARRGLLAAGVAAAATAGAGALAWRALKPAPKADPLIAVLPFDNLSADAELGYFADGLSEDILDALLRGGGMRVTSRASSFTFRGPAKAKAGEALKADYVLDGSVVRDGGRLRINARLNDVPRQQTLWSQSFDRDIGEQLQLEDEIAGQVASALRLRFSPARGGGRMIDPAVYDLYLKGRSATRIHTPDSIRHGRELLLAAVQQAPDFPRAWFELANNYDRGGRLEPLAEQEHSFALGREAARRAQALDPAYGAAFGVEQMLSPLYGRWAEIDAGLAKGLALSPNDADLLLWRGNVFRGAGRHKAGLASIRRAYALNPLEQFTLNSMSEALTRAGLFDEAQQMVDRIAVILPKSLSSYWSRTWLLVTARRDREAIAWLQNDAVKVPGDPTDEYNIIQRALLAASGDAAARRASALELIDLGRLGIGYACNSLVLLGMLQEWDVAADLARAAYLRAGPIKVDHTVEFLSNSRYRPFQQAYPDFLFHPFLKPLRASGRLDAVFDGIGLTAYWRKSGPPDA